MLTQRQMKAFGIEKKDYGHLAVAQRAWAAGNPGAAYRKPLTMDEYLKAADGLRSARPLRLRADGGRRVLRHRLDRRSLSAASRADPRARA